MAFSTDRHLHSDEIERYSMGTISEMESDGVDEHLLICELCRNKVTESDEYIAAMHEAGEHFRRQPKKQAWKFLFPRMVPLFSTMGLVVLVALVSLWWGSRATATSAYAVNLISTRGVGIDVKAPSSRPLQLNLELAGLPVHPSLRVEMVDRVGSVVWTGAAQARDAQARVFVPRMRQGIYFVRVFGPDDQLLREYGIEITA